MPTEHSDTDSLCDCKLSKGERLYKRYSEVFDVHDKEWTDLKKEEKAKWVKVASAAKKAPKKVKQSLSKE